MTVEDQLRHALRDQAASLRPDPGDWPDVARRAAGVRRRRRALTAGLTALAVVATTAVAIGALTGGEGDQVVTVDRPPAPGTTAPIEPATTLPPPPPVTGAPAPAVHRASGYQLLWPFASLEAAQDWQAGADRQGSGRLDPAATAVAFARDYLGYEGIDRALATRVDGDDARVTVGYHDAAEGDRDFPAAVVHLVRLGVGDLAPWEVVGTDDADSLTLTAPAYGADATSPLTVGGRITGVDEALDVQVRQLGTEGPLGRACCPPAGGEDQPWSQDVAFGGARPGTLTIAVSTGGHLAPVERFAVTGVRYGAG